MKFFFNNLIKKEHIYDYMVINNCSLDLIILYIVCLNNLLG